MFGKKKAFRPPRVNTLVGDQTKIEGDLTFNGGLHIDGAVHGNVAVETDDDEKSAVTISANGTVVGEVRVPNLILDGTVTGDVFISERVELAEHAKINGNLHYRFLEMAMGATVNGQLVHYAEDEPRRLSHDSAAKKKSTRRSRASTSATAATSAGTSDSGTEST